MPHSDLTDALRACFRDAASPDDARHEARAFLLDEITFAAAPALLAALPWPLATLFPNLAAAGEMALGGGTWIATPETLEARRRRLAQLYVRRWTLRVLLDHEARRDALGEDHGESRPLEGLADLADLERAEAQLLAFDDVPRSEQLAQLDALAAHPSPDVRGYAWLGWNALAESGVPIERDLFALAAREPALLRMVAVTALRAIDPARSLRPLFDETLDDATPAHVRDAALGWLATLPPEPYRDLGTRLTAIARASACPPAAWVRLAPSAWREALAWSEEKKPLERTPTVERRYGRYGRPVPTHVRTERAFAATDALVVAAPWLEDEAVEALVARAADPYYAHLLRRSAVGRAAQ